VETTTQRNIFVVSNRLPVRIERERGRLRIVRSGGGLAAALRGLDGVQAWIGWPGGTVEQARRDDLTRQLHDLGLAPVFLAADEERYYYNGMCNGTLWPLLHYFPGRIEFDDRAWPAYAAVNQRFADVVLARAQPGDTVWIHDFHLMLLPQLLRAARPELRIGFFLHVPFPSQELWRILPQREELLRGVLGADYIACHTAEYLRHFRNACARVLGLEADPDAIPVDGRRVSLGVDPLGTDTRMFVEHLQGDEVRRQLDHLEQRWQQRRLLLGVERLDYSKGILHKLQAFERLLDREPERREDTVMLQVLVPSRQENESYRALLREIQREVGRINGRFGAPGRMPLEFVHRSIDPPELAALYRFATVGMVTPVRDGMNLVAHEFVLCQGHAEPAGSQARGTLVLSEFAGAALSLTRALQVNPWDISGLSEWLGIALRMPAAERAERTREMYERVLELDSARWARNSLDRLARAAARNLAHRPAPLGAAARSALVASFTAARRRRVFLDYDGTLREITLRPEQAAPTAELRQLLQRLASRPATEVHLVSGRSRATLAAWFGALPLHLCAEHGFAQRPPDGTWRDRGDVDLRWLDRVQQLLALVCEEVPGSFVERKGGGIAWHYRLADPGYGPWRARELRKTLDDMLVHEPAETLAGHSVLEVRARGVDKGAYVSAHLQDVAADEFVFCAGDDRTDVDMYGRMPAHAFVVNVGGPAPGAQHVLTSPRELRDLLAQLTTA
jgi:trehalose 6-phosphate synthase/phosphatase